MADKILKILIVILLLIGTFVFVFWDDIKYQINYSKVELSKIGAVLPTNIEDIQFSIKDYEILSNGGGWTIGEPTAKVQESVKTKDFWMCGSSSDFLYCSDGEIYKKKDIETDNILGEINPQDIKKVEFCEERQKWNCFKSNNETSDYSYYIQKNMTVSPDFSAEHIQEFFDLFHSENKQNISKKNLNYIKNDDGSIIRWNVLVELQAYKEIYYEKAEKFYIAFDENECCYIDILQGNLVALPDDLSLIVKKAVDSAVENMTMGGSAS